MTSNRELKEWLDVMADPMLAQSAVDRFQNAAYELVIEGGSYRTETRVGSRGGGHRGGACRLTAGCRRQHHRKVG